MAYATGSTGIDDIEDLVNTLVDWLKTLSPAWVQDEADYSNDWMSIHDSSTKCYVSFRWDNTTQRNMAIYQALGYGGSQAPHLQTDDSGSGSTVSPATTPRMGNFVKTFTTN